MIFTGKHDYEHFLALLYLCNDEGNLRISREVNTASEEIFLIPRTKPLVDISAYCLMPNHFHILVREHTDGGVSAFMHKLTTSYTMYFNAKEERSGSLFQGTFKAEHAGNDRYLKYLIAYIHLNPAKIADQTWIENAVAKRKVAEEFLQGYQYSSYLDFLGRQRLQGSILSKGSLPEYFSTPISFKENMKEWLEYRLNLAEA